MRTCASVSPTSARTLPPCRPRNCGCSCRPRSSSGARSSSAAAYLSSNRLLAATICVSSPWLAQVFGARMDEPTAQEKSPSYLLPVEDTEFLLRDEMRAIRFALEYAKDELLLQDWGIRSTIIVFGGARVPSPEQADAAAARAQ